MRADQRGHRAGQALALAALVFFFALWGAPGTADAAQRKHPPCQKHASRTVASNRQARVYSVKNGESGRDLYGCLRSNGRAQLLTSSYDDGYVSVSAYSRVKLVGRFVAWAETSTDDSCKASCPDDYEPTQHSVYVNDLRSGKTSDAPSDGARRLVLARSGGIAWTEVFEGAVYIYALDRDGKRSLDSGADVSEKSLSVSGNTVTWTKAGQKQSAVLGPRA